MSPELGWSILTAVIMVIGLCGVVIPLLPGLALMWATALVYGFIVGYDTVGIVAMVLLSVLLAASLIKGILIPRRAAVESGASGWSQVGGVVGAVFGFFIIPIAGVIVGALAGVLVVEFLVKDSWTDAWTATKAMAKGFGLSVIIDIALGLVMITIWAGWALTVVF